jgi:hypothetical protein
MIEFFIFLIFLRRLCRTKYNCIHNYECTEIHCAKKVRDIVEFFEILRKIKKKSQQRHHGSFLYQICVKELLFLLHFLLNSFLMKCRS